MRLSWWRRLRLYLWHQGFSLWWPPKQDIRAEVQGWSLDRLVSRLYGKADNWDAEPSFAFIPVGEPVFSDVPGNGEPCATYEDAERAGARMSGVGNWRWFRIEKWYGCNVIPPESASEVLRYDGEADG